MYWWIRANVSGWTSEVGPFGADSGSSSSPRDHPARAPAEHQPELLVVEAGELGRSRRHEQRIGLAAVRVVGCVHDLLGRDLAVQVEEVEPAPHRRVEEHSLDPAEASCQPGHVRDPGVRDDQPHALVPPHERLEILRDRRKPAAAVDEDGHRALDREREDGLESLVAERERLRARMQLDPARSEVEAAPCLLDGLGGEVETDEREQPPARPLGVGERPIVGRGECRLAIGLVEAEHERAAESESVEDRRELVEAADHPVDVVSEVRVGVEEVGVLGKLAAELLLPGLDDRSRALECGHERRACQTRGGVIGSS